LVSFCSKCGADTIVCQYGFHVLCSDEDCSGLSFISVENFTRPDSTTGGGNVCANCYIKLTRSLKSAPTSNASSPQQRTQLLLATEVRNGLVLSVGKPKEETPNPNWTWEQQHRFVPKTFCWVKIQADRSSLPLLFKLFSDQTSLGFGKIKSGDLVYARFTEQIPQPQAGKDVIFVRTPNRLEVIGVETVHTTYSFNLTDTKFYDTHIELAHWFGDKQNVTLDNGFQTVGWRGDLLQSKVRGPSLGTRKISVKLDDATWKKYSPDFELAFSHNKIKSKLSIEDQQASYIEVEGDFRVFYNVDQTTTLVAEENLQVTRQNIISLKKIVEESELAQRWKQIRAKLREIMAIKHGLLSLEEAHQVFEEYKWKGNNVEDALQGLFWHKDYDTEYFEYIKELSKGSPAYFSEFGYYFRIENSSGIFTVWEVPRRGSSTYVFRGEPNEVVTKLGDMRKTEIWELKEQQPQAMFFYVGRTNHVEGYEDNYKDRLKTLLTGKSLKEEV
jgi:hypothetical protein